MGNLLDTDLPDGNQLSYARYGSGHVHAIFWNQKTVTDFERNRLHLETHRTLGSRSLQTQYDRLNRIHSHDYAHHSPNHPLAGADSNLSRRYHYNALNRLEEVTDSLRGTERYHYDKEGRLQGHFSAQNAQVQSSGDYWERFVYDAADNLLDFDASHMVFDQINCDLPPIMDNRLTQYRGVEYQYDAFGNLIERKTGNQTTYFSYNLNGELIRAEGRYQDDLFGMHDPIRTPDYPQQYYQVEYYYDALGRRIAKELRAVDREGQPNGPRGRSEFLWMGMQMLKEQQTHYAFDGINRKELDATETSYNYIYQADGDYEPIAQIKDNEQYYFYQNHINGAPKELVDWEGNIVWADYQSAWGVSHASLINDDLGSPTKNHHQPLRFQGQYYDRETKLHYNTFRYYDPHCGRFISQDPIGLAGGINLYQYAPNPIHWRCSKALGDNMKKDGITRPDDTAAHHIVGDTSVRAQPARNILIGHDIDIDDSVNGVFLPNRFNTDSAIPGILHNGRHPNDYIDKVNELITSANQAGGKQAVLDTLRDIGDTLSTASRNDAWKTVLD